jgi:hypothetical protein
MRVEREHDCGAAERAGRGEEALDKLCMTAMDAVEIADRERSAL